MDGGELGLPLLPLGGVGDFVLSVVEVVDYHLGVDVNHCVVLAVWEVADDGELGVGCMGCHRFFDWWVRLLATLGFRRWRRRCGHRGRICGRGR